MILRLFLLTVGLFHLCLAQTFDVATIRASTFQAADGEGNGRERIEISGDTLTMRNVTLRSCIGWAYSLQDFQISGALGVDRFDITAKAPSTSTAPAMRAMLGTLLRERFNLAFHRDSRELPSLALVVAKGGPKLKLSSEDAPGVLQPKKSAMMAQHATMAEFVGTLSGPLRTPVLDKTGLTERYDFTVDLSSYKPGEQPEMISIIMSALREQLGLNLESHKERVEILVIDHVDKNPSEN